MSKKTKNNNSTRKNSLIITLSISLISILSLIILLQRLQSSRQFLKNQYINEKYGWKINYPDNWKYSYGRFTATSLPEDTVNFTRNGHRIFWVWTETSNDKNLKKRAEEVLGVKDSPVYSETKIGGIQSLRASGSYNLQPGKLLTDVYIVKYNDCLYVIKSWYFSDEKETKRELESILKTFKFLE